MAMSLRALPPRIKRRFAFVALVIAGATVAAIFANAWQQSATEAARLQAIAELRSAQVTRWIHTRLSSPGFLASSQLTADHYLRWLSDPSPASRDALLESIVDVRTSIGYQGAAVLDADGSVLLTDGAQATTTPPQLRRAAVAALATGVVTRTDLYLAPPASGTLGMDVVVPLNRTGRPARGAIALHVDASDYLLPTLRAWPVPSRTGAAVLVRRAGDDIEVLTEHRTQTLSGDWSAVVLRGDPGARVAHRGVDFLGSDVMAATSPVDDSDWYVVAKVDLDEIRERSFPTAMFIAAAGLLALVAATIGALRMSDRHLWETTQAQERLEQERVQQQNSTELRRANANLARTEAFMRTITDNIPGRIGYWTDRSICAFVNRETCEWLGRTREELIGQPMADVFGPERVFKGREAVEGVLAGDAQHFEWQETTTDGTIEYSMIHFIPDTDDGKLIGFFSLSSDISDLKRKELRLNLMNQDLTDARQRAELATVAKSSFLANMSHEIRTPLNAIIGLTYLLRGSIADPSHQQRLQKISDAGQHLLSVVNDILDISKIEAGQLSLEDTDFSLETVLQQVCSLVGETATAKGLELVIDTDHAPEMLRGDPTRLSQALLNLMGNAVKFTAAGSVALQVRVVERNPLWTLARFSVRDTGPGIPPEKLEGIFSPFEQADNSTTRRFGGTGLGLSITRQLATLMDGEAGAESVLGEGSTFWFTAKLARSIQPEHVQSPSVTGMRALLVDDLPEAREALQAMLEGLGMRAVVAASGEDGLVAADEAAASGDPFSVYVLDWQLPGIDGVETYRRLETRSGRPSHAIIITAHDDDRLRATARAAGIGTVLLKPVSSSSLLDAILSLLGDGTVAQAPIPEQGEAMKKLAEEHAGARVLLVEDNPVNQEVGAELLQAAGLLVDIASNGRQAVDMILEGGYDIVFMDVQMPEFDGLQATQLLRLHTELASLPIIAMTANAFGEEKQACLAVGMNDHIGKPIAPDVLYATTLRWLRRTG